MEGGLQMSLLPGYSIDNDDAKYFSGLSTILVATIQELKDRISQIEYIFCSQLFPNFQSRSKHWQKRFAEAMKAAEDGWKKKENCLLLQVEELQLEKTQALEEIRQLVASIEKAKLANGESMKAVEDDWRRKESSLLLQIEELQLEKKKVLEENRCLVVSFEQETAKSINNETLLDEHDKVKKQLLAQLETLENNGEVTQLQGQLKQKTEEVTDGKRFQEKLFRQIEMKDAEVIIEKKKRKAVVDSYKRLKSKYNFLLNKLGLKDGSKMEEESNLSSPQQDPLTLNGCKTEDLQASGFVSKMKELKDESNPQKRVGGIKIPLSVEKSNCHSNVKSPSSSSSSRPQKSTLNVKSEQLAGVKRSVYWRDTRSRQEPGRADPHDDFLDTPMENIKGNLNKALKEVDELATQAPNDMSLDSSDDETQDLNPESAQQKQRISITRPQGRGFKYVEPVRKKADRENLQGFECKQCKKFYDAVLPDGDKNGENSKNSNFRCEHQDGVSRHRYRYLPPMTPEGFWNIGFESEM